LPDYRPLPVLRRGPAPQLTPAADALPVWKLEDAKTRFSELVRRARSDGAQRVTQRGKDAVIVMVIEDFEHLRQHGSLPRRQTLLEFLQGSGLHELELHRSRDSGRDVKL